MSYSDMIALKLQFGIKPEVPVDPGILQAMWYQLKLESAQARTNQSSATRSGPND
jgi:hypothetical protein